MYNRYIHTNRGNYEPVSSREPPPPSAHDESCHAHQQPQGRQEKKGLFSSLFGKLKLDDIDTGDLLLIAVIILLFMESEDEELLIALILLLIL